MLYPVDKFGSALALAGIVDHDGRLDKRLAAVGYLKPASVRLQGDRIVWGDVPAEELIDSPNGVLDSFLNLHDADAAVIAAFVEAWGPLYLRGHLIGSFPIPGSKADEFAASLLGRELPDGLGRTVRGKRFGTHPSTGKALYHAHYEEPVSVYRAFAHHLRDVLRSAAEIYSGRLKEADWLKRYPYHRDTCPCGFDAALDSVEQRVGRLLRLGGVSFTLDWAEDRWQVRTAFSGFYGGLLGVLATETMLAVARSDGLYTCSGCGQPYIRSARSAEGRSLRRRRRPNPGKANYCSRCEKAGKAHEAAKARYRTRVYEARQLSGEGWTIARIAERIGASAAQVSRWIKGKVKI